MFFVEYCFLFVKAMRSGYRHYVQRVRVWSFSGPRPPEFELNTEIYSVNLCIKSKCYKMQNRKTPTTDTFYAVRNSILSRTFLHIFR